MAQLFRYREHFSAFRYKVSASLQVRGTIYSLAVRNKGAHFFRYMKDSAATWNRAR
jgi:hypothetical protein